MQIDVEKCEKQWKQEYDTIFRYLLNLSKLCWYRFRFWSILEKCHLNLYIPMGFVFVKPVTTWSKCSCKKCFLLFHEQEEKFCQKTKCISFSSSLLDLVVCIIFGRRVVQATSQSINFLVQSRQSKVCQIQFKKDLDISNSQS